MGRYADTLQTVSAELNARGTDYLLLPDTPAPYPPLLPVVQKLLAESPTPLTRQELLALWPGEAPREDSLWRCLTRGCEILLFEHSGAGTKAEPFRYALARPAKESDRAAG